MKLPAILFLCFISTTALSQDVDSIRLMADLKHLSSDELQGRAPGTYGSRLAQFFLVNRFVESGLKSFNPDYRHYFLVLGKKIDKNGPDSISNYEQVRGVNVIGYIPGKQKEAIVISAHYDHVGVIDSAIYNGADDNASGVACMLAIADYFIKNPPQHTMIFAAFDAEEMYVKGARAFMSKLPVLQEDIRLNINMDLIGTNGPGGMRIGGTRFHPELRQPLSRVWENNKRVEWEYGYDKPRAIDDRTYRSDHLVFYLSKIPYVYFGAPEHPNYHKPTDDYENISHSFYFRSVELIVKSAAELDRNFPIRK